MWMFSTVSEEVEALAQALEDNPKQWVQQEYRFTNIKNPSISIWTANGLFGLKVTGHDRSSFNRKEKKRVLSAIHACLRKQIGLIAQEVSGEWHSNSYFWCRCCLCWSVSTITQP